MPSSDNRCVLTTEAGGGAGSDIGKLMAVAFEVPQVLDVEQDFDMLLWRFERLRRAGYHECAASDLAARRDVDLRLAEQLIARGCPQRTALQILR
jgi:hypothetical protein